jgi:hypothetical protein
MRAHQGSWLLPAVVLWLVSPATASGQVRFEVGPVLGFYAPVGSFATPDFYSTALPIKPSDLSGLAYGGEGRLWLTPRFGFQVQGAVASSRFGGGMAVPSGYVTSPVDAQVVTVTAQVLYRPAPWRSSLSLSAGYGVVHYGGDAYAGMQGLTSLAAVLGLGIDVPLGRRLTATLGVTSLLYSLNVRDPGAGVVGSTVQRGFRIDVLPHVTLAWGSARMDRSSP